jgi:hypothetical protein
MFRIGTGTSVSKPSQLIYAWGLPERKSRLMSRIIGTLPQSHLPDLADGTHVLHRRTLADLNEVAGATADLSIPVV